MGHVIQCQVVIWMTSPDRKGCLTAERASPRIASRGPGGGRVSRASIIAVPKATGVTM